MSTDQAQGAQAKGGRAANADVTIDDAFWLTDIYPDAAALLHHDITALEEVSRDCIVVLDGNILLWPYEYNTASLNALETVYKKLVEEKRLIVPGQAVREFYKHRSRKIGAISEKIVGAVKKTNVQVFDKIALLENEDDYAEARKLAGQMVDLGKQVAAKLEGLNARLKNEIGADPVSSMYREVLTGAITEIPMTAEDRKTILADAKRRARHEIAPGFKDAKKPDGGVGDLVIWYTLLQEAGRRKCDTIFVTDETKPDWWVRTNGAFHPRPELLEEYRQASEGKSLHLLPLSSLLELFDSPSEVVAQAARLEQAKSAVLIGAQLKLFNKAFSGENRPAMMALHDVAYIPASADSGESCVYNGVELSSRRNLAREVQEMKRIVDAMEVPLRCSVASIWCDSKAGRCYTVSFREGHWHDVFYDELRDVFMVNGGHNGVYIEGGPAGLDIDPDWSDDLAEADG